MPLDSLTNGPYLGTTRNPFSYEKIEQVSRDLQTEWLTLDEITQQLNLFQDESQDTYLQSLELATRFAIEDYLGMSIFPITWKVYYGATNGMTGTQSAFDLPEVSQAVNPANPGVTVNAVKYWTDGTPTLITVDPATYYYDNSGNKVVLQTLPSNLNASMTSPVYCEYTTAANPLSTYPVIKQAALLLLTHLYNQRSNTVDKQLHEIPFGVATLLRAYKPLVM